MRVHRAAVTEMQVQPEGEGQLLELHMLLRAVLIRCFFFFELLGTTLQVVKKRAGRMRHDQANELESRREQSWLSQDYYRMNTLSKKNAHARVFLHTKPYIFSHNIPMGSPHTFSHKILKAHIHMLAARSAAKP